MEVELYKKIKKNTMEAFKELSQKYLKQSWYIAWQCTLDSSCAVPLLQNCWSKTIDKISSSKSAPKENFMAMLSEEILKNYKLDVFKEDLFSTVEEPKVEDRFSFFSDCLKDMDKDLRIVWLVTSFGELTTNGVANALGLSPDKAKSLINKSSSKWTELSKRATKIRGAQYVKLSVEFTASDGSGLDAITVPQAVFNAVEHEHRKRAINESGERKEIKKMSTPRPRKRSKKKTIKYIIVAAIVVIAIILLIIFVPRLLRYIKGDEEEVTSITTYSVEEVTYDTIDTTISGSGTLSPIKSTTITAPYTESEVQTTTQIGDDNQQITQQSYTSSESVNYEVIEVNVSAGDEINEDDVIAVIEDEDGEETEIAADYDGIVLEVAVIEGDDIFSGSEIAMIMSEDGFELSLSIDELDVLEIEQGQEATVTVDALSEEYTGEVTSVSYNGTSNGSSASYQITVSIDYAEDIYPAMSASAEIVIESSEEGLIVPVNAVNTSGDDSYVYIAPSDAESGDEYDEDELTLSDLTKVTVDTDTTDGTNIIIESDEIEEGDLVIVTTVTSTLTGSSDDDASGFGGMMGGGGMDFSNMGDMDFSNMPQGGGMRGEGGQ